MTWFHCDVRNGNIVTCSSDERFNAKNCSDTMCKQFINVYTTLTLEEAREYKGPIEDDEGNILSKHSYRLDLTKVVPADQHHMIQDRECKCDLVDSPLDINLIERIEAGV